MDYRRLGNSGLEVSAVGLGANNFGLRIDAKESEAVIRQALELGINFIDTTDSGTRLSEEYIGRSLKGITDEVLVATKVGGRTGEGPNKSGASRWQIMNQLEISLRGLRREYVDLYQIHRPDPHTPIEETLRALDDLVRQGKVRYIGCSNFAAWQACEAVWTSRTLNLTPFVSTQAEYNILTRDIERELIPFCQKYGVGILPYFPLAAGFLTGKYRLGEPAPEGARFAGSHRLKDRMLTTKNFTLLARLESFVQERGRTVAELSIAWLLANPAVSSVIAGAMKPEQVVANAKASDWHLSKEDLVEIGKLLEESTGS